uniref:Integrase catalytic domain-containing protein n=1 Tax=Lactuca sativa TaxID=4236 RepID=A0A9R1UMX2_LACSA|nr:hypothetical protein LSAT_V11C800399240 [Lactuca sativa]
MSGNGSDPISPISQPSSSSTIESSNPLFLASSDNLGTVLVSKVFDGTGFASWKRSMTFALSAKNKLGSVNGTIEKPAENSNQFEIWNRVNSMCYEQANGALIYQIQKKLFSITQGSEDFSSYFTKMKKIWDELNMIQDVSLCTCGSTAKIKKYVEEQRLIQLLMGLNESYKSICSQILMMNPLPSIDTRQGSTVQNVIDSSTPGGGYGDLDKTSIENYTISNEQYQQLMQLMSNLSNNFNKSVNSVIINGAMDSSGEFLDLKGKHFSYAFNFVNNNKQQSSWIIDSGATDHICCDQNLFSSIHTFSHSHFISLPNGQSIPVTKSGKVPIHENIILNDVLYAPQFKNNLISVTKVTSRLKVWILFTDEFCAMYSPLSKSSLIIGKRVNDIYSREYKLLKQPLTPQFHSCLSCDHSRCTWVYLLKNKSGAFSIIKAFVTYVKVHFKTEVKTIRTDNAFELGSSQEGALYFQSVGISHQKSCPYKQQQNGVVERKHKHLLEVSRALFFQSGLGKSYWGDCVLTAAYTINRTPLKVINNSSLYEVFFNPKPNYTNLKTFGCLCYIYSCQDPNLVSLLDISQDVFLFLFQTMISLIVMVMFQNRFKHLNKMTILPLLNHNNQKIFMLPMLLIQFNQEELNEFIIPLFVYKTTFVIML